MRERIDKVCVRERELGNEILSSKEKRTARRRQDFSKRTQEPILYKKFSLKKSKFLDGALPHFSYTSVLL